MMSNIDSALIRIPLLNYISLILKKQFCAKSRFYYNARCLRYFCSQMSNNKFPDKIDK